MGGRGRWVGHVIPACSVESCDRLSKSRGYCEPHYNQWRRGADVVGQPIRERRDPKVRNADGEKRCRRCDGWKPESAYPFETSAADGLNAQCRSCRSEVYKQNAEAVRDSMRRSRFGLDRATFDAMFAAQGNVCAICRSNDPGSSFWAVDHDHACCPSSDKTCGKCVRGILCRACNQALGNFKDDAAVLAAAIAYLDRARQ